PAGRLIRRVDLTVSESFWRGDYVGFQTFPPFEVMAPRRRPAGFPTGRLYIACNWLARSQLRFAPSSSITSRSPSAYRARKTFLSNLPTDVLGTAGMNAHRSGSHHAATLPQRNARSASASFAAPSFSTTQASGRSSQVGSGTPITAASTTSGCPMILFSRSTDEIHSPPDLMTSFARSVIWA